MPPKKKKTNHSSSGATSQPTTSSTSNHSSKKLNGFFQTLREVSPSPDVTEVGTSTPAASLKMQNLVQHLSSIVHGMYLVTRIEKAQIGADRQAVADGPSGNIQPYMLTVGNRWFDAVTQYCNVSVTLDDLARAAEAFPSLLAVKWIPVQKNDLLLKEIAQELVEKRENGQSSPSAAKRGTKKRSRSQTSGEGGTRAPSHEERLVSEDLTARIQLLVPNVPSAEECARILSETIASKGTVTEQRQFKHHLIYYNAFAAYRKQCEEVLDGGLTEHRTKTQVTSQPGASGVDKREHAHEAETPAAPNNKKMLELLSPQLRETLSEEKLAKVLAQLARDATGEDAREERRLHTQQANERVVSSYELFRSLFLTRKRVSCNAAQLISEFERESRFQELSSTGREQLAILLRIPASGLHAITLEEAPNGSSSVVPGAKEVSDTFASYSSEAMESILINYNRDESSLTGIREALNKQNPPDSFSVSMDMYA